MTTRNPSGYRIAALSVGVLLALACGGPPVEPESEPPFTIVANHEAKLPSSQQQAEASSWKAKEPLKDFPGAPSHYEVYPGGGEGDCAIDALQFDPEGSVPTRLFFVASCFGDTSERTVSPVALADGRFALRSDHSYLDNAQMKDDGTWTGDPVHKVTDTVYQWTPEGLVPVAEPVKTSP
jgi:hypothetical protein